jgi:hypothetical protein
MDLISPASSGVWDPMALGKAALVGEKLSSAKKTAGAAVKQWGGAAFARLDGPPE